jgi:sn-glycerol 3-phosphate transport system permease protein
MNKVKTKIGDALVQVIAVMIGLILIFPIVYCVCSAFKTPGEFALSKLLPESFTYLANFKNALHQAPLMRYMLNSVSVPAGHCDEAGILHTCGICIHQLRIQI